MAPQLCVMCEASLFVQALSRRHAPRDPTLQWPEHIELDHMESCRIPQPCPLSHALRTGTHVAPKHSPMPSAIHRQLCISLSALPRHNSGIRSEGTGPASGRLLDVQKMIALENI